MPRKGNVVKYMLFETLYQKTKTGAINSWRVYTIGDTLYTEFGQVDGKMQTTIGTVCVATNVGKSNERNPKQQATFQAEAMIKDQLRLKYSTTIESASEIRVQPMLAQDGHKSTLPNILDVQIKFDGGRCMTTDVERVLKSRGNKTYNVRHITEELKKMFPADVMTDGELYIHGVPLQKIMSLIKKPQLQSKDVEYHIYDLPSNKTWSERKTQLSSYKSSDHIKIVETFQVDSIEKLNLLHDKFVLDGYEGAIIRLDGKGYEFGKRSSFLLKWKTFEDKEFKIISIGVGIGKMSECPIFTCQNDLNNLTFNVVPIGTMEVRKEMLDQNNVGKLLTVKFIGRTEDMIPKMAVGKTIREDTN